MLGGEDQIGCAEESIGASSEHGDGVTDGLARLTVTVSDSTVFSVDAEVHIGTLGASNPVALHGLYLVRPVEGGKVINEAVRVGGNAHHPLAEVLAEHGEVTALGLTLRGDLFIRQHGTQSGAPVNSTVAAVYQALRVDNLGALHLGEVRPDAARIFAVAYSI